jgi:hypothetical protein
VASSQPVVRHREPKRRWVDGEHAERYPNGTNVTDTTTWSAYILGEPVRIIQ